MLKLRHLGPRVRSDQSWRRVSRSSDRACIRNQGVGGGYAKPRMLVAHIRLCDSELGTPSDWRFLCPDAVCRRLGVAASLPGEGIFGLVYPTFDHALPAARTVGVFDVVSPWSGYRGKTSAICYVPKTWTPLPCRLQTENRRGSLGIVSA